MIFIISNSSFFCFVEKGIKKSMKEEVFEMKKSKKKNGFGTTVLILIVIVATLRGIWQLYALLGFLAFSLIMLCIKNRKKLALAFKKAIGFISFSSDDDDSEEIVEAVEEIPAIVQNTEGDIPERMILRHINHRITDKLKSVYPNASWDWNEKPTVSFITDGGTRRIFINGTEEYNYANVVIDKYATISLQFMKIADFAEVAGNRSDTVVADYPVDVEMWFTNRGQELLGNIIGDLNARGVKSLSIDTDGKISCVENNAAVVHGQLEDFPQKNLWAQLTALLTDKFELKANIDNEQIIVSW